VRIIVAADLHVEVTGVEPIRRLVAGMSRENPDLVVLAGDLGNPSWIFEQCLTCFLRVGAPVAVVPGNHDIWSSAGESSHELYHDTLPAITRSMGFHWLEDEPLALEDGVGVCGSIGWYDYSARAPELNQSDEELLAMKPRFAMDAVKVNWDYTDQSFAAGCRDRITRQARALQDDRRIDRVLAITHVPVFDNQIDRRPHMPAWSQGNAYFGHLTMGESLLPFGKITHVLSGHTHVGMNGLVERPNGAIATAVVSSDYGRPRWITIEL
jgi:predicted MPP superfamily phosphohydrolase